MSHGLVDKSVLHSDRVIPSRPEGDPNDFSDDIIIKELIKCSDSPHYFINNYVHILDDRSRQWIPFKLYPVQVNVIDAFLNEKYINILKTRQVGMTTLIGGACFLWLILFEPNAFALVLSKSEREAQDLLTTRFKPSFNKLPYWLKPRDLESDSKSELALSTGSVLKCLPTSGGDSYTARAVLVDEAALVHRSRTSLSQVLLNVEPTVDAGGQLILLSKADKEKPDSTFNSLFRSAVKGENEFFPVFIPWQGVPWRDKEWYERKKDLSLSIDGTLDHLHESYPETIEEALSAKSLDKRLNYNHLKNCYIESEGLDEDALEENPPPALPGLSVFVLPGGNRQYIACIDPAEGNPSSDDSVVDIFDWDSGEQVANVRGKFEPTTFAEYINLLCQYYNKAPAWVERNNHGHAVIQWLQNTTNTKVLSGPDSSKNTRRYGYLTTLKSKALAYVELAKKLKDDAIIIHHKESFTQLVSIEGSSLRAPGEGHDDFATTFMLYAAAKKYVRLKLLLGLISN